MDSSSASRLKALAVSDPLDSGNRTEVVLVARFHLCLQLADDGLEIKRQALRRHHPSFDEKRIEEELRTWLAASPPTGLADGWTVSNPVRFST